MFCKARIKTETFVKISRLAQLIQHWNFRNTIENRFYIKIEPKENKLRYELRARLPAWRINMASNLSLDREEFFVHSKFETLQSYWQHGWHISRDIAITPTPLSIFQQRISWCQFDCDGEATGDLYDKLLWTSLQSTFRIQFAKQSFLH